MNDMPVLDRVIGAVAPKWALRRAQYRRALAHYYEAVKPSRSRRLEFANPSGDGATYANTINLRAIARDHERNHDLVRGAINVFIANTIGTGIGLEPQPRRPDGTIHDGFSRELRQLWKNWCRKPEVTHELDWGMTQRLVARRLFVDGEILGQHVFARPVRFNHGTIVPYSVELIEADRLADYLTDPSKNLTQGIERTEWGRPTHYWIYKGNPGEAFISPHQLEAKRHPASRFMHLKFTDRVRQARGVSPLASVLNRLADIKDYEESERIAAKVAASMAAVIKKGDPTLYDASESVDEDSGRRDLKFTPGMIFDDLLPGESVETIDSSRPNPQLVQYRAGQLRAVAAGAGTSYSSLSKDYNGTYSAQRQEMVEQWGIYAICAQHIIAQWHQPVYSQWLGIAQLSGSLRIPPDVDPRTIDDALWIPPQMPWIDPLKEAQAWQMLEQAGYASAPEIIRRRGQQPEDVLEQEAAWRRRKEAASPNGDPFPKPASPSNKVANYGD